MLRSVTVRMSAAISLQSPVLGSVLSALTERLLHTVEFRNLLGSQYGQEFVDISLAHRCSIYLLVKPFVQMCNLLSIIGIFGVELTGLFSLVAA